jgi:hypothetical protein
MWSLPHLTEELASILRAREAALREEQAVHGLDRLEEVELQALLAAGLTPAYLVAREQYYPSANATKKSARTRCDFVLARDDEELWLEVKLAQQRREGGAHNPRYAQQWRCAITDDLRKLRADQAIRHAAIAFIAFTDDEARFEADAATFERMLVDEALLCGWRSTSGFPIVERIGHARCTVAAWPIV